MDICIRCQPRTVVSPAPPTATRAALWRRRRLFAEPLCFASCLQMVSLRPVQACFAILHTVGGVIDHPPPPHSSWNWMSVTAALSALSVFGAAGTSWVKCGTATGGNDDLFASNIKIQKQNFCKFLNKIVPYHFFCQKNFCKKTPPQGTKIGQI